MTAAMKRVFICGFALAVSLSLAIRSTVADASKARKKAAEVVAKEISRLHFHKLYVADFLDSSGQHTENGCYFSSAFSAHLKSLLKDVDVVNRIDGRRLLDALAGSAADAQEPESILKFKTILNADVTLTGVMRMTGDKAELLLSLHDVSTAKQLIQLQYREKLDASFNSMFPAATDSSGRIFYFSIMDGVVSPQCRHCPQPEFTDQARATKVPVPLSFQC